MDDKADTDDFLRRIALGEDSSLELKRVSTTGKRVTELDSRDMADEFASAANAQGTTFLLGVCDKTRKIGERQFTRNELVCTCLSRCPLEERFADIDRSRIMDRRGEGVPVIISASRRQSGFSPEYRLSGDAELKLTIFSAPVENREALAEIATSLSSAKQSGLQIPSAGIDHLKALVEANPRITQSEMAKACGVSRTTINNWIRKSNGTIRRVGFDNGGHWEVRELGVGGQPNH